jgi:hypothetical protein
MNDKKNRLFLLKFKMHHEDLIIKQWNEKDKGVSALVKLSNPTNNFMGATSLKCLNGRFFLAEKQRYSLFF